MMKNLFVVGILLALMAVAPAWAAKVDVNKADAAALMENLKGIGPVKAKAIIDYRKKHGNFKTMDDLAKVPGIGEATIQKNRANLSLKGGVSKASAKKPASSKPQAKAAKKDPKKDAKKSAKDKAKQAKADKSDKAKKAKDKAKKAAKKDSGSSKK